MVTKKKFECEIVPTKHFSESVIFVAKLLSLFKNDIFCDLTRFNEI
jgi:hypothetical protein